jgi:hypothetical protein
MYKYKTPSTSQTFGPLAPGDYTFEVTRCDEPRQNDRGNLVLSLRLAILPNRVTVFAHPWAGTDKRGEYRDSIAEFLLCVGRAPQEGEEPDWDSIVGARGRCRIKTEVAERGKLAGQLVNVVAWFHRPSENVRFQNEVSNPQVLEDAQGDGESEPDSIPF